MSDETQRGHAQEVKGTVRNLNALVSHAQKLGLGVEYEVRRLESVGSPACDFIGVRIVEEL